MTRALGSLIPVTGVAALLSSAALAHEGDVGLRVDSGRIVTWALGDLPDPPGGEGYLFPTRVFLSELAFDPGFGLPTIDDPGFAAFDEPGLQGRPLAFNIVGPLRAWSGGLNGNFDGVSPVRLGVGSDELELDFILTPTEDVTVPGHVLTFPGDFDFHFDLRLQADEQGIYLLALEIANPGGPLAKSDPIYIVLNYGLDEEFHEAAEEYVNEFIVPTPAAAALLALGGLAAARRRR